MEDLEQKKSLVCVVGDFSDACSLVATVESLIENNYVAIFSNVTGCLIDQGLIEKYGEDFTWDCWQSKENTTAWSSELEDMVNGAKDWFELSDEDVVDVIGEGEHYEELVRKYHRIQEVVRES